MMIKITILKAILIGSFMIALAILFRIDGAALLVAEAKAEVAGMSYRDLRRDRDFKKAVKYIVENCTVSGSDISC